MKHSENHRNKINSFIMEARMTMSKTAEDISVDKYGQNVVVFNLSSRKLRCASPLHCIKAAELAAAHGYKLVRAKYREGR